MSMSCSEDENPPLLFFTTPLALSDLTARYLHMCSSDTLCAKLVLLEHRNGYTLCAKLVLLEHRNGYTLCAKLVLLEHRNGSRSNSTHVQMSAGN